jgi:hypothetical protein
MVGTLTLCPPYKLISIPNKNAPDQAGAFRYLAGKEGRRALNLS